MIAALILPICIMLTIVGCVGLIWTGRKQNWLGLMTIAQWQNSGDHFYAALMVLIEHDPDLARALSESCHERMEGISNRSLSQLKKETKNRTRSRWGWRSRSSSTWPGSWSSTRTTTDPSCTDLTPVVSFRYHGMARKGWTI